MDEALEIEKQHYTKLSSGFPNNLPGKGDLQAQVNFGFDDYRKKATKKAEPNHPTFFLLLLIIDLLLKDLLPPYPADLIPFPQK